MAKQILMTTKKLLGKTGEDFVVERLQQEGFAIRHRNYQQRCGEIDIIAEKGNVRVFVEVKLRQAEYFALSQLITPSKQRKIVTTARLYNSAQRDYSPKVFRFDVALITRHSRDDYALTYIQDAFTQGKEW